MTGIQYFESRGGVERLELSRFFVGARFQGPCAPTLTQTSQALWCAGCAIISANFFSGRPTENLMKKHKVTLSRFSRACEVCAGYAIP